MKTPIAIGIAGALGAMTGFVVEERVTRSVMGTAPSLEIVSFRLCAPESQGQRATKFKTKSKFGITERF